MIDLSGQRVLVTGGSRGIGRATALLFARAGANVGITYHTRQAEAEAVAREIRAMGRRAFSAGGDLADPAVVSRVFRECKAALGGLDCFVANAGIWPSDEIPLGKLSEGRWRSTLAQNLDAVFLTTRAALELLGPGGRIVLVSSTAGQRGEAFHADYAATKGALIALTKSLAVEYAPGINVNCVAPGWVDTEMSAGPYAGGGRERIAATIPLRRIPPPEDIAGPILFLCSPLARHVTGEILNVNGGSVLCG
ncbi:MAG TPA: SDR family NAD(P)-dependent oxidoreductase [Gemmatimonadales bacterium]|jgi:3-oxoacyl-[acyl-carrier protein] reductase|nr:SDR family NAD(P)-dependent oxidoreductase [Gemmatimonadales bacterium]